MLKTLIQISFFGEEREVAKGAILHTLDVKDITDKYINFLYTR